MPRTLLILSLLAVVLASVWLAQADEPGQNPRTKLMKQKLTSAQKLLEGLALQNFVTLEKSADELSMISNKAEWQAAGTPEYVRYSDEFRRHCGDIAAGAKKKNIDAATLGYLKLTTTCVECHKHLRETKITFGTPVKPLTASFVTGFEPLVPRHER